MKKLEELDEGIVEILFEYRNKGKSLRQIAKDINNKYKNEKMTISHVSIRNILLKEGFYLRNKSQALTNYWRKWNEKNKS